MLCIIACQPNMVNKDTLLYVTWFVWDITVYVKYIEGMSILVIPTDTKIVIQPIFRCRHWPGI